MIDLKDEVISFNQPSTTFNTYFFYIYFLSLTLREFIKTVNIMKMSMIIWYLFFVVVYQYMKIQFNELYVVDKIYIEKFCSEYFYNGKILVSTRLKFMVKTINYFHVKYIAQWIVKRLHSYKWFLLSYIKLRIFKIIWY